ncbi:MAG: ATP-dependent Clp protease adapter ClpS [Desulfobacteraceae bacterium]|nr:ATP-dependent Clp protease adapter ClpS [Desulfobacteraceae bacterium]MCF8094144.1 ATP-dependent Clp protease adapter ClpS [Desulfobacteraceae bacterium]
MQEYNPGTEEEVISETRKSLQEPPMFRVVLHNDDYTTMDFVVELLMHVFYKSFEDATRIMLRVHRAGKGECGVYTYEVAETKIETVHQLAKQRGFPLKSSMEKV